MKRLILSSIFVLVCGSSFAKEVDSQVISQKSGSFTVQPGDYCYVIGSYIQNYQCKGKNIKFISSSKSGRPTMCVWNDGWVNGDKPPKAKQKGYFSC